MRRLFSLIRDNQLLLGSLMFLVGFALTRYPYYSIVNLPYVFDDTPVYVGNLAGLNNREFGAGGLTLGYPAFLGFCRLFSGDVRFITYMQSAMTLVSGLLFLFMIHRSFKELVLLSSLALTIYTTSILFVHFETAILTECMFANCLTLSAGAMAAVLSSLSAKRIVVFSSSLVLVIVTRPAGLYLLPIGLIVLLYIAIKTREIRRPMLFLAPMILYYGVIYSLSAFTHSATASASGLLPALATNSLPYLEKDSSFSDHLNEIIGNYVIPRQNVVEQEFIKYSDDVLNVSALYLKYQRYADGFRDSLLAANQGSYEGLNNDYRKIVDVIWLKNRNDLFRFFKIQFLHYFDSFDYRRTSAYPFFASFQACFREARVVNYWQCPYNRTGYASNYALFEAPRYSPADLQFMYSALTESRVARMAGGMFQQHHRLFRRTFWLYAYVGATVLLAGAFVRSKRLRPQILFLLLMSASNMIYMFVVSVNISMIRYNFPLHLSWYLVVLLSIAVLWNQIRRE